MMSHHARHLLLTFLALFIFTCTLVTASTVYVKASLMEISQQP